MFTDYYELLGVNETATSEEIIAAFRNEIKKYHPDLNMGNGDTERTRLLIEAKLILLDAGARAKYDKEHQQYKTVVNNSQASKKEYEIQDEELGRWINNAKQQAKSIYKEILSEFKESAKATVKGFKWYTITYLLPFIIGIILFKTCDGVDRSNSKNSFIEIRMQIDASSIYKFTFNKGHQYEYKHGRCISSKKMRDKGTITISHKEKFIKILYDNGDMMFNIVEIQEFKKGNGLIYICKRDSKSCRFLVDFDEKTFRWMYEKNHGEEVIVDFDLTQFQQLEQ